MNEGKELAKYAVNEENSKGRTIKEKSPKDRTEFQRDYSRIIHSNAWRKLQYKTQVFANHKGDHFRTRLSHSLEVSQVSQSVAKALNLNEDLATTLAISHDLGHAPFGHQGQDVLNELMADYGGFEHNMQALRIVDKLEKAYPEFDGLNLMFETKEGLLKHYNEQTAKALGECGNDDYYKDGKTPSLEAQVVNICDSIAYNHGDLEDGFQMGVITLDDLMELEQFAEHWDILKNSIENFDKNALVAVKAVARSMFTSYTKNLVSYSKRTIESANINSLYDVKNSQHLISFGKKERENHVKLKAFLKNKLYHNPVLLEERENQSKMIQYIFNSLIKNPNLIDNKLSKDSIDNDILYRKVCDHISGMTDRLVVANYKMLKGMSKQDKKEADEDINNEYSSGYNLTFKK